MKFFVAAVVSLVLPALLDCAPAHAAGPQYTVIRMEITVAKPAADVWAKVGKYCDIAQWLNVECSIASGDGGIGTVRLLRGGSVTEVLVAQTALSYAYTQPAVEGKFYNLYHGNLEAVAVSAKTSKLIYTLLLDQSDKPDEAAKQADVSSRRTRFEAALQSMKKIAEGV